MDKLKPCPMCDGKGRLYEPDYGCHFPATNQECPKCHGTGEVPDEKEEERDGRD